MGQITPIALYIIKYNSNNIYLELIMTMTTSLTHNFLEPFCGLSKNKFKDIIFNNLYMRVIHNELSVA